MSQAYDAACARLGISPADPKTGMLAATIVQLAREGVTDTAALCDGAVDRFA
jgi:hypothetical protein